MGMPYFIRASINGALPREYAVPAKYVADLGQSPAAALQYWRDCFSPGSITRAELMDKSGEVLQTLCINGEVQPWMPLPTPPST